MCVEKKAVEGPKLLKCEGNGSRCMPWIDGISCIHSPMLAEHRRRCPTRIFVPPGENHTFRSGLPTIGNSSRHKKAGAYGDLART